MAEPAKAKKNKTVVLAIAGCIIGLGIVTWGYVERMPQGTHAQRAQEEQSPTIVMTPTTWRGIGIPPGKRLNAWPLRDDVSYWVRLDRDPKRVHLIQASGAPSQETLVDIGTSGYTEFKLCDSQSVTSCEVAYEIVGM